MATQLQLRRGTATEINNFTGADGELVYNKSANSLHVHDGKKKGGWMIDTLVAFQAPTASNNYTWYRKYASGWVEQGGRNNGTLSGNIFSQTLPVKMATRTYFYSILPELSSSDTGNYLVRGVEQTNLTKLQYYMFYNNAITTNNPRVVWMVCGMAA